MKDNNLSQTLRLILLAAPLSCLAQAPSGQPAASNGTAAVPAAPQPSATLLNVVCQGGQLTISAHDSTLASILAEVDKCIGAKIDLPDTAAGTRFFDTIGPGPVRDVLASLFTASGLNYVIGTSSADPNKVETVLLMAQAASPSTDAPDGRALTPARRAFQQMRQNSRGVPPPDESDAQPSAEDSDSASRNASSTPPPENPAASAANQAAPADPTPQPTASDANPSASDTRVPDAQSNAPSEDKPKTVEDQITNMQQLFQQRQQMMQQPNSAPH